MPPSKLGTGPRRLATSGGAGAELVGRLNENNKPLDSVAASNHSHGNVPVTLHWLDAIRACSKRSLSGSKRGNTMPCQRGSAAHPANHTPGTAQHVLPTAVQLESHLCSRPRKPTEHPANRANSTPPRPRPRPRRSCRPAVRRRSLRWVCPLVPTLVLSRGACNQENQEHVNTWQSRTHRCAGTDRLVSMAPRRRFNTGAVWTDCMLWS